MVELRKITEDNLGAIVKLEVSEAQKNCVAENSQSIMEAYVAITNGEHAVTYGIFADEVAVGFVMYTYSENQDYWTTVPKNTYYLWRLMIDKNHQGKGYGKQAMKKIIEEIKTFPLGPSETFTTSYEMSEAGPKKFYESLGFKATGEIMGEGTDAEAITILKF
jgi:diamine N-acetyltransferase